RPLSAGAGEPPVDEAPPPAVLIVGGELLTPAPAGRGDVLLVHGRVARVGAVDRGALDRLGLAYAVVDAADAWVAPGLIDAHEHLLGGSGEGGLSLQSPMLNLREIVRAGITTVVGVLGVDTTMKTMAGLLGHVKGLAEEGITTRMWSGGYNVPPTTVMGSIREDMLFLDPVIGAGEIAVSDERGLNQSAQELAKLVRDTHVGGLLTGKAGVTHFHVGEEETRLQPLRDLIDGHGVKPEWLYPTHVQRNARLLDEAIELARAGATVDFDTAAEDLPRWYAYYRDRGGPLDRLTASSDADSNAPDTLARELCRLVRHHGVAPSDALRLVTENVARVLKLGRKGRLAEGMDGDVVVLDRDTFAVRHVAAMGRVVVADGAPVVRERFLAESKRDWHLRGDKAAQAPED
ncbi:amidohydrolase family protein, partial [Roseisolibacter sp. H3M3-2]|uniref:amidohydrolase family protein n=1 Tax=Roseisolibacter sp. H3M3-2 TaxID=3031323 RepID=UPI0023DAE3B6